MKLHSHLSAWISQTLVFTFCLLAIVLSGCKSPTVDLSGSTATPTNGFDNLNKKQIRIVSGSSGSGTSINDVSLTLTDSLSLRAALYDFNDNYIQDVPVIWAMTGTNFPSGNLATAAAVSSTATFTPSTIGSTVIQAVYVGTDQSIVSKTDTTGTISVNSTQTAASLVITGGNNQSGVVNANLPTQLQVKVTDVFGREIVGTPVQFTVTQGTGSILSTNPALTDASGIASVLVKLGTEAGANSQKYRATSVDTTSLTVDFLASTVAAGVDHLTFATQPAYAYAGSPFGTQPQIGFFDSFSNPVIVNGIVTLSVVTGTGSLVGTATASVSSGSSVSFSDVGYSQAENGVVLKASFSGLNVSTSAFNVAAAPPGACQIQDAAFTTTLGGCRDNATNLVWSKEAPSAMTWDAAIWDSTLLGSDVKDSFDYGRTNDFAENNGPSGFVDSDPLSYCHSLNQGGFQDWRLPSKPELQGMFLNASNNAGSTAYIASIGNNWHWSATTIDAGNSWMVHPNGSLTGQPKGNPFQVACVRAGRQASNHLTVTSGPTRVAVGTASSTPLLVQIRDAAGNAVNAAGITVTLGGASIGALGGTLTAQTDSSGLASFGSFTFSQAATSVTFNVTSSGLTATTYSLKVVLEIPPGDCVVEDSNFITATGGCKDVVSGLVWSKDSSAQMTWYKGVWDSYVAAAAPADSNDYGRTSDYSESSDPSTYNDNDPDAYCHSLTEGGYYDWRLPTQTELQGVFTRSINGGAWDKYLRSLSAANWHWSSDSYTPNADYAYMVYAPSGVGQIEPKVNARFVICVRDGRVGADRLVVTSGPSTITVNSTPGTSLIVQVKDSAGNRVNRQGLTITIDSATVGTLGGSLSAVTNTSGQATFNAFTLDTPTLLSSLEIIASGLTSAMHNLKVGAYPHTCSVENASFRTQEGGCKDQVTKFVWSLPSGSTMTWDQAIWDSTSPSGNTAADGDDGVRVDDYDLTQNSSGWTTERDTSFSNYCHSLNQGGYTDWRVPTLGEWTEATGDGAPSSFGYSLAPTSGETRYWSSTVYGNQQHKWQMIFPATTAPYTSYDIRSNLYKVICIRPGS